MKNLKTVAYLFLMFFSVSQLTFAAEVPEVTAIYVSGSVEVCGADESEYKKIEEGEVLEAGDKIKTGKDSYVELAFDEDQKNVVRIDEGTSAKLTLEDNEKMEMSKGEVFASIGELAVGSSFEIRTPTVVAGARGTEWTTRVDEQENTTVEAFQDSPYVKSMGEDGRWRAEVVKILPGHMTTVRRFQRPAPLMRLTEQHHRRWNAMRAHVRSHAAEAKIKRRSPDWLKKREHRRGIIPRKGQPQNFNRGLAPGKGAPGPRRPVQPRGPMRKF